MPRLIIDAIAVVTTNMARTREFYRTLGFEFEGGFDSADHVEPLRRTGEPRLMIDSAALVEKLNGEVPRPPNHSIFAMLCETPADVDGVIVAIKSAGFDVLTVPFDAFWGQRYATVSDPDGYRVDIFAPL